VLVVGVVVGAVVRVVVLRAAVAPGAALAGPLFAAPSLAFLPVAPVFSLFLFLGREVAAGNFLKHFVGNLLGAVADGFEGQGRHPSDGQKSGCCGLVG
jgi:hypothetical protein